MEYRRLGSCGLKVSELCLGTMTFGYSTDERESGRIVQSALDAGVTFFDTANTYAAGASERILGTVLGEKRKDVVVATKFFNPFGPGPNDSGVSRHAIYTAVTDSLSRLGTDYIDLYYVHHVDTQVEPEETLRALDDLVRTGKVRYIACSNYPAWRVCDSLWTSTAGGLERFVAYQGQYNLVVRDLEEEVLPLCLAKKLGLVAWGPIAGGFLTGKYQPGERVKQGTRSEERWVWMNQSFASNADEILRVLIDTAGELGRSPTQVALRFLLRQPGISSVIAGARTSDQFTDSLGALDWELEDEAYDRLERVSRPTPRYPRSFEERMHERRDKAVQTGARTK
ncbi:MAG: aldo/keto reductase [bacterium]